MKVVYLLAACILLSATANAGFLDSLSHAFSTVGNAVKDAASKVVEVVKPVASAALDGLKDHAGEIATTAATTAAQALLASLMGRRDLSGLPEVHNTIANMEQTINDDIDKMKQFVHATYDNYHNISAAMLDTPFDELSQKIDSITNSHIQLTNAAWSSMIHSLTKELEQLVGHKISDTVVHDMTKKLMDLYRPTQTFLHQLASKFGETLKHTAVELESQLQSHLHQVEEAGKTIVQKGMGALIQN